MNRGTLSGTAKALFAVLCLTNLVLMFAPARARGELPAMHNYCSVPPDLGFKPNLLVMMDNSASMYDLSYTDPANYCLDDSVDTFEKAVSPYPGYFEPQKLYSYNLASDSFEPASSQAMPPTTCNAAQKGYLCVNISSGKVDNFLAGGSFLNWLAMSKLDIEKKALTGGNYDPDSKRLQAESRGCQGKRFVKMVGTSPVTLVLRGPIPSEGDYVYRASNGGQTRIEVYANRYSKAPCLDAVKAWQNASGLGAFKTAALGCMNNLADPSNASVPSKGKVYTEIMSDCYASLASETPPGLDNGLNLDCKKRLGLYGSDPDNVPANTGEDVCGGGVNHTVTDYGDYVFSSGYLGECFSLGGSLDLDCAKLQMNDFCHDMLTPTLTDPSLTAAMSGTNANLPAFILDAGVTNLGKPAGTLRARVVQATAPTGLIQQFANEINFGAMVFNDNGAGSECGQPGSLIPCVKHCQDDPFPRNECNLPEDCESGQSCSADSPSDGGTIISYINHTPLGDHAKGSGLIASIDAVRADSWTPLAETFYQAIQYFANRGDLRLQAADFDPAWPPSQFSCQKNNLLLVTDGMSTADRASAVNSFVAGGVGGYLADWDRGWPALKTSTDSDTVSAAPAYQGSYNLDDLAWIARNKNITNLSRPVLGASDYLSSYVVYTGAPCDAYDGNGNCTTSDEAVPEKMMQLVASKGGGKIANARNPANLETALREMLALIGTSTNSGTDASILSTGSGNGAIFLSEQFYPTKSFDGGASSASWVGEMQSLWYYIDPFLGSPGTASTIREDSDENLKLDLVSDRVVQFSTLANKLQVQLLQDSDGNGTADAAVGAPIDPDQLKSLWRAGKKLWSRDLLATPRAIYTPLLSGGAGEGASGLMKFTWDAPDNSGALEPYLQAAGNPATVKLMQYLHGFDFPGDSATRSRTLRIGSIPGASLSTLSTDPYVSLPRDKGIGVWKLGDIISSTPALQSAAGLGSYHLAVPRGYNDSSYSRFTAQQGYQGRGTVYVGANDGMLHAFRLGGLQQQPESGSSWPLNQKAALAGSDPGREEWAFIPGNALPYLRYLKEPGYSHLNLVDGSLTLVDASLGDPLSCARADYWNCPKDGGTGKNWRTVLIGGMGLGGASKGAGDACGEGDAGTCVKAPLPSGGLSSYFALDVTGQAGDGSGPAPKLLWEFAPAGLGFATSGAAIVKLNARSGTNFITHNPDKNGRWFAVFASGPTGAIDSSSCQFQGKSDQNLKLFVIDLNAVPPLVENHNYWVIDTGIQGAFGGSMAGAGIDTDRWNRSAPGWYEDDALYLGYTRKVPGGGWTTGGVLRLLTRENPDPAQWKWSTVIDGIGPVTGSVAKLQDRASHNLWLYFGTGRYFYNQDDMAASRALFGVKEPCYTAQDSLVDDATCSATPLQLSDLGNASLGAAANPLATKGWWIGLDGAGSGYGSERMAGNPSTLTGGSVFFTTFKPSSVPCLPGASYLWRVKYNSGGSSTLSGQAVVALSNGSSKGLPLAGWSDKGGRRSEAMTGRPGGVKVVSNSGLRPLRRIIHIQER